MKKPYALVFDLGNVLLPIDLDKTYEAFAFYSSLFSAKEIRQITENESLWVQYESGLQSDEEFEAMIVERFGLTCSTEQFQQSFNALLLQFDEEHCAFIKQLSASFPIYLLSNTSRLHAREYLNQSYPNFNLFDSFGYIHLSFEMGMVKPDVRIYNQVVECNQLHDHQVIFFDDNINNIESAKNIGWETVLINPETSLQQIHQQIQSLC